MPVERHIVAEKSYFDHDALLEVQNFLIHMVHGSVLYFKVLTRC